VRRRVQIAGPEAAVRCSTVRWLWTVDVAACRRWWRVAEKVVACGGGCREGGGVWQRLLRRWWRVAEAVEKVVACGGGCREGGGVWRRL
jgi:hypothetical protein